MGKKIFNKCSFLLVLAITVLLLGVPALSGLAAASFFTNNTEATGCTACEFINDLANSNPDFEEALKNDKELQLTEGKLLNINELQGNNYDVALGRIINSAQFETLYEQLKADDYEMVKTDIIVSELNAKFKNKLTKENETVKTIQAIVPLINNSNNDKAMISFAENKFGIGVVASIIKNEGNEIQFLIPKDNGQITTMGIIQATECWVCKFLTKKFYNAPQIGSCKIMCGGACLPLVENLPAMGICNLLCNPICTKVIENPSAAKDAEAFCTRHGYCE